MHRKLLYVGLFQVCLFHYDGKDLKYMKHSLELVAQITCSLILSILSRKCVNYDLRFYCFATYIVQVRFP